MAIIYATSVKTARMTATRDAIDAGAGAGSIEIGTTGFGAVLAAFTLSEPCGTVSNGVLTFTFPVTDAAANATGTAAEARVKDGSGAIIVTGLTVSVTGGGGDVQLDSVSLTSGQQVTLNTGSFTHA